MRKLNQNRRDRLVLSGFFEVEANILKVIPLNAPYMKLLRNDRIKLVKQAYKEKWSRKKFEQTVAHQYVVRGWKQEGERLGKSNIFKMVRDYEAIWRNTAPPDELNKWVSPSAKKTHHGTSINREKLRRQKQEYNNREDVKLKRANYRRTHRSQIAEARRKAKEFKRNQGKR